MSLVVWFTGLSGSGKSTISLLLKQQLQSRCIPVALLDGDVIRQSLSRDLGFSPADRAESLRRIDTLAAKLSRDGKVVLVAAIAPYRSLREEIRSAHTHYLEVFVDAPLHVCETRDPKGLYRKARAGEIPDFTGISAPYERPHHPDLICRTASETVAESAAKVLAAIEHVLQPSPLIRQARAAVR